MVKHFAVLVLCALASAAAGAVVKKPVHSPLVAKRYSHLQVEIDEWERRGLPTELSFGHVGNSTVRALVTAMPSHSQVETFISKKNQEKVLFHVYNRNNAKGTKVTLDVDEMKAAGWVPDRPTKMVIHGYANNIESDLFTIMVPMLLHTGDYNVIGVEWGELCQEPYYIEGRYYVDDVGRLAAELVDFLVNNELLRLADLHVIGHSLGAHVAGNVGKHVSTGKVHRITGLDPAMPLFLLLKSDRLHKSDAELVDVVHTCANLLGLENPLGHVDFYPNQGKRPMPGCGLDLTGSCSHGKSYKYFAESLLNEEDAFVANYCKSESEAMKGKCDKSTTTANMGMNLQYSEEGAYYLETADAFPYDMGIRGLMEDEDTIRACLGSQQLKYFSFCLLQHNSCDVLNSS